ncbi:hypothetical protein [Natrialba sp. INN-245]|uniref:hypothetical protein n=1 Tax=Natrialba sp. INN-245 TaxID=2690967 RepID=UPI001310B18A|nr:hypothetical protein [Natrialba sp. INN-245]MWV41193.1 hypothetical protein [Natrialba sp. INN-245]
MSATFGEVREWNGSTFDPSNLRVFSYLPEQDADEAYCVRHDREMDAFRPAIHRAGALYEPGEGYAVYSCAHCRREFGPTLSAYLRHAMRATFDEWDDPDGQLPRRAFDYVDEGSPEDALEVMFSDE